MRKLKLFFACLLMTVLSIGQVWGTTETATLSFSAKCNGGGTDDQLNSWTVTSDGTESNFDNTKGIHYGTNSAQVQYIRLSTSGITGTITQVKVNASTASGVSATVGVTVGGAAFGGNPKSLTTSAAEYTFTDEATGAIVVEITKPSKAAKAIYCKSVEVTYSTGGGTVAVTSVELDETSITLDEEATQTLTATVLPNDASNKNVTWESDDESVATVADGVVTAVGAGDATITCKSVADNTKSATCLVHVNPSPYTKSKLIFTSACGGSGTADDDAEWTVESDGTESSFDSDKGIHYGTSGAAVQYIQLSTSDIDGTIAKIVVNASTASGVSATVSVTVDGDAFGGEAQSISASPADYKFTGSASGEIIVTVTKPSSATKAIYVKSVIVYYIPAPQKQNTGLAYATANYLVKAGASLAPELTNPNSLTGITYASSDADVVAVDENTGALTIKAAGKAVITASRAADETYKVGSASYTVYVATEAGTAADPLTEASAKALIDLGCGMEAHVHGTVLGSQDATKFTVTLAGGFQFYKLKDIGNVAFESAYIGNGDEVTAVGTLTKYNSTYELADGCYLTAYTEYTEPLVDISNTKATAYTVAEALALAVNPTSDLTKAVYIKGVVYDVKSFNSTNGTLDIYIKDNGVDNKFEFYKCAGIYDESLTAFTAADDVQEGDEVIGYGVMKYYSNGNIWEFDNTATGDYLVQLTRPEIAVSSIGLDQDAASIEVNETVTLHATVNPDNASNKAITWSVQSGSEYASVADGVVTGLVAGTAVIRAASTADPTKYAECTVTVAAADPTKHVVTFDATVDQGESPLSKSNISMACSSGVLDNGSEYRLYKNSITTFECSVGNITKIEFTGVSGNPVSGFGDPEVGNLVTDGNDGVWTGNAASVSFTASGAQVRATEIKVTYKEDTRAAAGLEWSTDAVVLTVGDAFTAPTLTNPNSIAAAEITIASDNTALAQVENGVVSLVANATGTAHITATFTGNDDYKPATVSYTITVNAAPTPIIYVDKLNVNFGSVAQGASVADKTITVTLTDVAAVTATLGGTNPEAFSISKTEEIVNGDVITISVASTANTGSFAATIAISDGAEGAEDKTVNLSLTVTEPVEEDDVTGTWTLVTNETTLAAGKKVIIAQYVNADGAINTMAGQSSNNRSVIASTVAGTTLTPAVGTKVMTLADAGEGHFYLKTSDGEYLYNASISSKSYLRTKEESENASWTITVNAENKAIITSVENENRTIMRYNENGSNPALFNCYASGQNDIVLYMLEETAPQPQIDPIAEIGGKFIINAKGDTAVFSRGNLQYNYGTDKWYVAEHQYDFLGEAANLNFGKDGYDGAIDLFGWSNDDSNYGRMLSNKDADYMNNHFVDWGGLFSGDKAWSTFNTTEMKYVLANQKWTTMVLDPTPGDADNGDEIYGLAMFPYNWVMPAGYEGIHYSLHDWNDDAGFADNTIALSAWADFENAGAVFLPMAGARAGYWGNTWNGDVETETSNPAASGYDWVDNVGWYGYYWLSTPDSRSSYQHCANYLIFLGWGEGPTLEDDDDIYYPPQVWSREKRRGNSVRLITRIPRQYAVTYDVNGAEGEAPVDGAKYLDGADVTLADASGLSKEGYVFAGWKFKGETYNGTYTVNNVLANEEIVFEAQWEKDWQTVREDLTVGNHYTVCLPKNVTDVKGATFWSLSYRNNEETFAYLVEETAPFDAAVPYVIQATEDKLQVVYGDESESEGKTNSALVGTLEELSATVFGTLPGNIYIIKENALRPRIVGQNWLPAYRAYVNYDALSVGEPTPAPGRRVKAMPLQKNTPTGIDALNASETPVKMLIDGQIYILRGEKIYDATGRLVK